LYKQNQGTAKSVSVTGLPASGTIYVRLHSRIGSKWVYNDYTYTTKSYQITATVSGLSNTGLVLQNNGAIDVAVSGNGTVSINAAAASGSAYAVTVKTQPTWPSQTCVVANGSGTVTNANVSNISVTCTTNAYRITATVSGLSGTGLVLQNNGTTELAINSNGTFVINSAAASGSVYAVTVKTQPSSPTQTCVVVNGAGTIGGINVSNISVNCATNMYAVSATVSGLSGTGLVLQNNGATDLPVSGNGTFVISNLTVSGSPYAVTVKTQPNSPTQTCVVSNGSGTVTNATINNISVTCTTNTYQITATVSGLSGAGLVLQNNGANGLSVNSNGTFIINSAAASGSIYAVTVSTQPTSPIQTCVVANGSGTVTSSNVSNITVSCAAPSPPTITSAPTMTLYVIGVTASTVTGTVVASDSAGRPISYSIASPASRGTASINSSTGVMTYTLAGYPSPITATGDSFVVSASNGATSATATITVNLNGDPLLPNQWHLQNTGQDSFSDVRPVAGFDINVAPAWAAGFSGQGIKVGVVDSGLEIAHEDLAGNVDAGNSIDFRTTNGTDPTPIVWGNHPVVGDHGTSVAGIIASEAFNGKGGRGVAFRARLRGYNWIAFGMNTPINFARSFGADQRSADNDIFNGSFGGDIVTGVRYDLLPEFDNSYAAVLDNADTLRGGKGAVVVFSSGNNFSDNGAPLVASGSCLDARNLGVTCSLPAASSFKQSIVPLIVGALAADGRKASYSNTSSSTWVSAPGGETSNMWWGADMPTITTANLAGCEKYSVSVNALDNRGVNPLASRCQYTATMSGTSAAAPMVAGVVALMLEANPNLTSRDVAHILAVTARKVDPTFTGVSHFLAGATRTLEGGWTTNAAGYSFSNRYGFGAVDAGAAVAMARTYTGFMPSRQQVGPLQFLVGGDPSIGSSGKFVAFQVNSTMTKTERAFIFVSIINRNFRILPANATCTHIELASPSGTRSVLLNAANGFSNGELRNVLLSSNAFYGENPNGTWRMWAYDWCSGAPILPTQFSTALPQKFALTGH
jgi:subtilisin family serine protease